MTPSWGALCDIAILVRKRFVLIQVELVVRKGHIDAFITRAYSAPHILWNALVSIALGNLDAVLRPPPSIKNIRQQFWRSATIPGKLAQVTACWDLAPGATEVFRAKKRRKICAALSSLPCLGASLPDGSRQPAFFPRSLRDT